MIVAGEPSGDLHASHVVDRLKALYPNITFFGMGGDEMERASVKLDFHIRDSAVMGFADVITVLPIFLQKQAHLKRRICEEHPDVLLLVDFAEFNMPLAKFARSRGVPVVYYIPPKAWAWRTGRARKLAKWANIVAAIFPFEAEFYRNAGANAEFVGHPLVDFAQTPLTIHEARAQLNLDKAEHAQNAHVIGLMPGSRRSEIQHILPVMLRSAADVTKVYPNVQWILALAPGISTDLISKCQQVLVDIEVPPIKIVEKSAYPMMRASTLILVTSGTATLEATCIGTPMIILFRTSALNWNIIRSLSSLNRSGLPNLIAGHDIVPELLQTALTPTALTDLVLDFLENPEKRETQRQALQAVYAQLGTAGAAERTAKLVLEQVR